MVRSFLKKAGYTLVEVTFVTALIAAVPTALYMELSKKATSLQCMSNLRNIHVALQLHEVDNGRIPDAAFFPESADDPRSIVNVLASYIDDRKIFLCPSLPDELGEKGVTYIWNDTYNRKFQSTVQGRGTIWMVTEMTVVDNNTPAPHRGYYNVLYLDGHVSKEKEGVQLSPAIARW